MRINNLFINLLGFENFSANINNKQTKERKKMLNRLPFSEFGSRLQKLGVEKGVFRRFFKTQGGAFLLLLR